MEGDGKKVFETIIMASISLFAAFSMSLNKYAKDRANGKELYMLLYLSEALISGISGMLLGLIAMVITDNPLIWIVLSGIGGFAGRGLLLVMIKILIMIVASTKNIDIEKLNNLTFNSDLDENTKKDNDDEDKNDN